MLIKLYVKNEKLQPKGCDGKGGIIQISHSMKISDISS